MSTRGEGRGRPDGHDGVSGGDTRDIALNAYASAASAHKRLDSINGQIGGLRSSHELMRDDFNEAHLSLATGITALQTTVGNALKVAGVMVALVLAVASGVSVYMLTHLHHQASTPIGATQHK